MKKQHRTLTRLMAYSLVLFVICSCDCSIKTRIREIKKAEGIPEVSFNRSAPKSARATQLFHQGGSLWKDLYLEDSTIVFVFQESDYVNGIWGDDYIEYYKLIETERVLSSGAILIKNWFKDINLSNYSMREIMIDSSGKELFSFNYKISELENPEKHFISLLKLERLLELSKGLYPIYTIEGVHIEDAIWNETTERIDFLVNVNRRSVEPYTYYDYDESQFKSFIKNNWRDLTRYGIFEIIDRNGIPICFTINNQGQMSSLTFNHNDYNGFHQANTELE